MTGDRRIPEPTAEQLLQEHEDYRKQRLVLGNDGLDGRRRGEPINPGYTITRWLSADYLPVTDRASQQLAKRCSDLYDSFRASETTTTDATDASDKDKYNSNNNITTNKNPNSTTTSTNNNNNPPNTTSPLQQPPLQHHHHHQTQPQTLLHISPADLHEYTTLLHNLHTPTHHAPLNSPFPFTPTRLAQLHDRLQQLHTHLAHQAHRLNAHAAAVASREAALSEREEYGHHVNGETGNLNQNGNGDGYGYGHGNNQALIIRPYVEIMEGILACVSRTKDLAGCPPPVAAMLLEKLEAEVARLVNEGRSLMTRAVMPPGPAALVPAQHAEMVGAALVANLKTNARTIMQELEGRNPVGVSSGNAAVHNDDLNMVDWVDFEAGDKGDAAQAQ
ncbi:uncharacterized protein B0H64DRAFT_434379 [Chaetomium fimeti]|uniref:Uncharacterized protein n=1 Tax=Chaetomium fimeti TaxID=1854472 RepID=A0AAE0LPK3_9PEZI|nr:hypothetical protein B0H64DRAFT_434379 [Chaetomium fimeti]